ncbi:MAG: hypothetical protein ACM3VS_12125 [Candidatus Dadabacteria bacterium]
MRCYLLLFTILFVLGCDAGFRDRDERQIKAKDLVRWTYVPNKSKDFNISSFREDTITRKDSLFKKALRYTLHYEYLDSTGALQKRTGDVFFTPDGRSIISSANYPKP